MSMGDGGSIVWDVQDYIDSRFAQMDQGVVLRIADDARKQARMMTGI